MRSRWSSSEPRWAPKLQVCDRLSTEGLAPGHKSEGGARCTGRPDPLTPGAPAPTPPPSNRAGRGVGGGTAEAGTASGQPPHFSVRWDMLRGPRTGASCSESRDARQHAPRCLKCQQRPEVAREQVAVIRRGGPCVRRHCTTSGGRRIVCQRAHHLADGSSTLRCPSLTAATMGPAETRRRPWGMISGSIVIASTCLRPFMATVTIPPPAVASISVAAKSCRRCSCICTDCSPTRPMMHRARSASVLQRYARGRRACTSARGQRFVVHLCDFWVVVSRRVGVFRSCSILVVRLPRIVRFCATDPHDVDSSARWTNVPLDVRSGGRSSCVFRAPSGGVSSR